MSIKSTLRNYLLGFTELTDLIGSGGVFLEMAPEGRPFPYVVMHRVTNPHVFYLGGAAGFTEDANFQLDVVGEGGDQTTGVRNVIVDKLNGFKYQMGTDWIQSCLLQDENDDSSNPVSGGEVPVITISMDFFIAYDEPVPTLA